MKKPNPISVATSPIFAQQLADLILALGENRSRVIVRAVAEAHAKYVNPHTQTPHLPNSDGRDKRESVTTGDPI